MEDDKVSKSLKSEEAASSQSAYDQDDSIKPFKGNY
jgi:hypothetical protein